MDTLQIIAAVVVILLALVGRSAYMQGELRQFLRALLIIAGLIGTIALAIYIAILLR